MSEVTDLVMPILQKIQQDMSDMRRSLEAKINDIAERQLEHGAIMDETKRFMTLHMGMTLQHRFQFETVVDRLDAVEKRLSTLEARA